MATTALFRRARLRPGASAAVFATLGLAAATARPDGTPRAATARPEGSSHLLAKARLEGSAHATAASSAAPRASGASWAVRGSTAGGGFAPDPAPRSTRRKWAYDVSYRDGRFVVGRPTLVEHERPTPTPRAMGRFAIELYVGRELLDRVRFDVPLLNGEVPAPGTSLPRGSVDWAKGANVHRRIEAPDLDRATYAVLVDRATGERTPLVWPPAEAPSPPASASAR
jgi:hypothetical protein